MFVQTMTLLKYGHVLAMPHSNTCTYAHTLQLAIIMRRCMLTNIKQDDCSDSCVLLLMR